MFFLLPETVDSDRPRSVVGNPNQTSEMGLDD